MTLTKLMSPVVGSAVSAQGETGYAAFAETWPQGMSLSRADARSGPPPGCAPRIRVASPVRRVSHAVPHRHAGTGTELSLHLCTRNFHETCGRDRTHGSEIEATRVACDLAAQGLAAALKITDECLDRCAPMPSSFNRPFPGHRR